MRPLFSFPRLALGMFAPLCVVLGFSFSAKGQVVIAPPPTIGSSNPVSAEPLVTRPSTTPCKVTLLTNQAFQGYSYVNFSYAPPSACAGPWAKVVFSADFTVSEGRQFDRSSAFYLGGATLFRGTTAEPRAALSPSWHVESDVTDLSALMTTAQAGLVNIGNTVDSTYTGIIYANAELDFYPTSASVLAATVPDAVIPIVTDATNPNQTYTSASPLTVTLSALPKNMTQLYLNVYSQHGGGPNDAEEFWYLSTPNAQAAPYINNNNQTALREVDVTIDGTPAGVAPDRPFVFTGGIDPYLWEPITAAQTLNLKPYRINLTPFAGLLSDGNPHTIVLNDINVVVSGGYDSLNADLLVYTDHGGATTGGAIVSNTLTTNPGTTVSANVNLDSSGNGTAEVSESLARTFTISGYTNTSAGKVTTTVTQTVNFANSQQLTNSATPVLNSVAESLTSTVDSTETTATTSSTTTKTYHTENPITAFINYSVNADGTSVQIANVETKDVNNSTGPGSFTSSASEDVTSTDQLDFDSSGNLTSHNGQASTGTYTSTDSDGNNYSSTLNAVNNVLTGATTKSSSSDSTLFLTSSVTTANQGDPVTITAKIIPANSTAVPTGYVTFYDNGNVFSVIATSTGGAVVTTVTLPAGTDVITASYTGDTNFNAQTSINSVTVTVAPTTGTFTIGPAAPATLSLSQGKSSILSVPVTGNSIFNGTVNLTCSGAPSGATCTVNPTSVSLSVSSSAATETSTVSVLIATAAPVTSVSDNGHLPGLMKAVGGISVAGILMLCLPRRRGRRWNALTMVAVFVLGLGSMAALNGCGGKAPVPPTTTTSGGTPTGTYTITVTGTSGGQTQTATFSLTVTQ